MPCLETEPGLQWYVFLLKFGPFKDASRQCWVCPLPIRIHEPRLWLQGRFAPSTRFLPAPRWHHRAGPPTRTAVSDNQAVGRSGSVVKASCGGGKRGGFQGCYGVLEEGAAGGISGGEGGFSADKGDW